jgi:UDP-glucose 4-epimerase
MEVNGDGSAVREFTHVADVAQAYLLALAAVKPGEHELFNIGTGRGITVRELLAPSSRSPAVLCRCGRGQPSPSRPH